jgi:hypothetical protein
MVWDTRDLRWQQLYSACQQYAAEHHHLNVPATYRTPDGYCLGTSLKRVRAAAAKDRLDPSERVSLEELGMVFASGSDRAWNDFLTACDRYVQDHGDLATVEKSYIDDTGDGGHRSLPGGGRLRRILWPRDSPGTARYFSPLAPSSPARRRLSG